MQFVDEEDHGIAHALELHDKALHAFLELAAVLGTRNHRRHVERHDALVRKQVGNLLLYNLLRKALDNRSLANARFTDKRRVVLLATAKNLDQAFDFRFTPDNRVELACTRHRGEVTTEVVENRSLGAGTATRVALRLERTLDIVGLFGGNAIVATVLELVQHLLEILERHVERGERSRSRGIRLLQDGKHQMFRTDVLVAFHLGNLGRIEKDRLGLGRKREQASTGIAALEATVFIAIRRIVIIAITLNFRIINLILTTSHINTDIKILRHYRY